MKRKSFTKARDELEQRIEERTRELRESETRFRTVVDSSPAAITLKAAEGVFIMINDTYGKWMKTDPSKIEGKNICDLLPGDEGKEIEALDRKIFETGEAMVFEGQRTFRDGVTRTVLSHKNPVFSEAGGLLLELLSDILDVSKVEAGELEIDEEDVEIAAVIKECRTMVLERANLAKVDLVVKVEDGLPKLFADRRRLKQVLLNLLTNAIKFTPEKGKITIHGALDEDGGIILGVSDTGIGIAPEDIPKILQPFGQFTDAYVVNTPGEGLGLGLSLVNSLVLLHGGRLEIDSAPGAGTRVFVYFPPQRTLGAVEYSS